MSCRLRVDASPSLRRVDAEAVGKHPATLSEISKTGAKLSGAHRFTEGEQLEFRAGNIEALGEILWADGSECAIAFDIAIAEVSRLRDLTNFVAAVSKK